MLRIATSPCRRGFGSPCKVSGFARGSPTRRAVERKRDGEVVPHPAFPFCTTFSERLSFVQPLRQCFALPPLLVGEALAVLAKSPVSPEALLPGELSSGCETERLYHILRFRFVLRFPKGYPSYNLSVTFGATSPGRRGFGSPCKVSGFARGSPTRGAVERMRD